VTSYLHALQPTKNLFGEGEAVGLKGGQSLPEDMISDANIFFYASSGGKANDHINRDIFKGQQTRRRTLNLRLL